MPANAAKLTSIVEKYLAELRLLRTSGGATGELSTLGDTTFDIHLNDRAYWRNVPSNVWAYKLGGYQVLKKWLSYRESKVLARPLTWKEVHHFAKTARRIAAILNLVDQP